MAKSSSLPVSEVIEKTCGSLWFLFYTYEDAYHMQPVTLDDMINGILYLDARNYIRKRADDVKR